MGRKSISLCMIVKNEERVLERCLRSTEGIVDEIIIVDTGSTDRTIDIAKTFHARIYTFEWINDFAAARNEALNYATGDYILVLDADEYIDRDHRQLLETLEKDLYYLNIKSSLTGGFSTVHPVIRLFRNLPEFRFTGKIHEQILVPGGAGYSSDYLQVMVHHDGYMRNVIEEKNKEKRNLEILLEELKENESGFVLFNLGIQYKTMKNYEQAIKMLEKAFPLSVEYSYVSKLIGSLVQCYIEIQQYENALRICNEAIAVFTEYTDLYYFQGLIYESLNYYHDALRSYKLCLELGEVTDPGMITFQGVGSYMALTSLARLYFIKGYTQESIKSLTAALQANKHFVPAVKMMIDLTRGASEEDALSFILKVWPIDSADDLREMMGVLYKLRHPLLYKFSEMYQHNVDDDIKAIMFLYSGRYREAAEVWLAPDYVFDPELQNDLLLCAILLKDPELIRRYKNQYAYREKDLKLLIRIAERTMMEQVKLSSDLSELLVLLFEKLIVLKEFESIDFFVSSFPSYSVQFGFAKQVYNYGFKDIAFQIMEDQLSSVDREGLIWIANGLMEEGNDVEGLRFFNLALSRGESFDVLESCYELYERNHQRDLSSEMVNKMKSLKPESEWAKQLGQLIKGEDYGKTQN